MGVYQNAQNCFPPLTLFSENNVALFSGGPKICNEIHLDWRDPPPFSENSLFLPPQNFRKNPNEIFRIGNDPPSPSEVFRKFIKSVRGSHPLKWTLLPFKRSNRDITLHQGQRGVDHFSHWVSCDYEALMHPNHLLPA